jgi:hypothetical protein
LAKWLLLHYKIPSDPSALRVYVWRKLKRLGALLYHDAVWVLPDTPREREQFQWLAAEIDEMGGQAALWEAQPILGEAEEQLIRQFTGQVDQAYAEIIEALDHPDADPDAISRQYQQVRSRDYFQSELGKRVRDALLARRGVEE